MDPDAFTLIFVMTLIFVSVVIALFVWMMIKKTTSHVQRSRAAKADRQYVEDEEEEAIEEKDVVPEQVTIV